MTTISVPLPADLLEAIDKLITMGIASNKADAIRRALKKFVEDQEVESILKTRQEPNLAGDLDELAAAL